MRGPGRPARNPAPPWRWPLAAAALAWAAFPAPAAGQQEPAPTPLTLAETLELAARNNPEYRQALNELELTGSAERLAWGAFLPALSLRASTDLSYDRRLVTRDVFGNPIPNPVSEWRSSSGSSQGVSLGVDLFDGGRRFRELDRTRAEARAGARAAEATRARVRGEVTRRFLAAQEQAALVRVEEELLEGRRQDLEATRRLFALAAKGRVDVLAAELEDARQEQAVRDARGELEKRLLTLATVVGLPQPAPLAVSPDEPEPLDPAGLEAADLVSRALASSPRVLEQRGRVQAGEARLGSARAERWPSISFSAGFFQSAFAEKRDALFDPFPTNSRYGSLGLDITIPLFSRFQTSHQIVQAETSLQNARESRRQAELSVAEDVRARLLDLRMAVERLEVARRALDLAEERLRLAREEYRLAGRSFEELQAAVRDAATERRSSLAARFQLHHARADLEEALGAPLDGAPPPS